MYGLEKETSMITIQQLQDLIETTEQHQKDHEAMARNVIAEYELQLHSMFDNLSSYLLRSSNETVNTMVAKEVHERMVWSISYAEEGRMKLRLLKELLHKNI